MMATNGKPQGKEEASKESAAPASAEGEMEGVEGEGAENTSLEESLDVKLEGEGASADDGDEFDAEELVGDGGDMEGENDEGVSDISWVEELWKKKTEEENQRRRARHTKEVELAKSVDVDFEMKDESGERTDSAQKEQAKDPGELNTDEQNKTAATSFQRDTEEQTTMSVGPERWDNLEFRLSYIKRCSGIPRAYFGPAFDDNLFQCCVRIYPVVYAELVLPEFAELLMSADIVRMRLGSRHTQRSLELYCQKSIDMVRKLMAVPQSFSVVTIEIERRQATGWKDLVRNEKTYKVPTGFTSDKVMTAKFNLKKSYFRQNLSGPIPVNSSQRKRVKERSLFLNNLPQKVEGILLKHVFPLASKIDLLNVSESTSSAVLMMKSQKMVIDHLVAVTEVCINGQAVEMGAVDTTQEAELIRYENQRRYQKQQNRNRRQPVRNAEQRTDVRDTSSIRNYSSSKAGLGDSTKKPSPEEQQKRDQERKEREKKNRELNEKQRQEREKRDREQREKMQKERERQRQQVQKGQLESSRQQKDDEKTKSRKRELAQKEFSRMKKDARNARAENRGQQQSGRARTRWNTPYVERVRNRGMDREMQMHREMEMREMGMQRDLELAREMEMKEMELRREMEIQREMEMQRDLTIEREMQRQREMQQELEREMERKREYEMAEEHKRREQWEWEEQQRQKTLEEQARRKEDENDRRHKEKLLRDKEKLEKMHQNAVLKLMMVEEQQRRERDELQRREQEMAAENKRLQQKLEEERRRQQREKDEWEERMSRKRSRLDDPGAMGPELRGMASGKKGRGGGFYAPGGNEPVTEESMKRKLELEVARQAEELKKSLAILDKIQKDPVGISGKDKALGAQPSTAFNRPEQASQHGYSRGQDYERDMSHFQYPHAGGPVRAAEEDYDSLYGAPEPNPFSPTTAWGAETAETSSWRPHADLQTGGYSQAPRQWTNSQRQGGQQAGSQGQQRVGQAGQKKDGSYQQLAWRSADSSQTGQSGAPESAYTQAVRQGFGGGYAQAKRQGGGSYGQTGGSNYGQKNMRGNRSGGGGRARGRAQARGGNY